MIFLLLSIISILFIASRGLKRSSDSILYITNIQQVQESIRSFQSMYALNLSTAFNMLANIITGHSYTAIPIYPASTASGKYNHIGHIPDQGELAMYLSPTGARDHRPNSFEYW